MLWKVRFRKVYFFNILSGRKNDTLKASYSARENKASFPDDTNIKSNMIKNDERLKRKN